MPTSNIIKLNAKKSLKNKWSEAFAITALLLSVYCLNVIIAEISLTVLSNLVNKLWIYGIIIGETLFLGQFFIVPILYGILRWFWYSSQQTNVPISEIFCYFVNIKMYLRAVSLGFRIFLRVIFILLICCIPAFIIIALSSPTTYELLDFSMPYWATYVWLLGNVFTIFGIIVSVIMLLRYFAAPILMINDDNISPQEALHLSVIISKTSNGQTFAFICSFIGWFLLSILCIPLFFTIPYFFSSYCEYSRYLINNYNNAINPPDALV